MMNKMTMNSYSNATSNEGDESGESDISLLYDDSESDYDSAEEDELTSSIWNEYRLDMNAVSISMNGIDQSLLNQLKNEAQAVQHHCLTEINSFTNVTTPSAADFVSCFINQSIIDHLLRILNKTVQPHVSVDEFIIFVRILIWMSFYGKSPEAVYSFIHLYQPLIPLCEIIKRDRFSNILNGFGVDDAHDGCTWKSFYSPNRDMSELAEITYRRYN